jgi:predicted nucleic acid-binding protein
VLRTPWTLDAGVGFLGALFASPSLGILIPTERHALVLADVVSEVPGLAGNIVHDTQTAVLMREHGIRRVCSRDTDFHRFPFLEPIDPMTAEP